MLRTSTRPHTAMVVAVGLAVAGSTGCGKPTAPTSAAEKDSPVLKTREEFRAMLKGKTQAEVLSLLGPPPYTSNVGGRDSWTYENVTFDPANGKADFRVNVFFFQDKTIDSITF